MIESALAIGLLLLVEWPWAAPRRSRAAGALRVVVAGVMVLWIVGTVDVGPARRAALSTPDRVTTMGSTEGVTPYVSGVLTMTREAARGINGMWVPLFVLGFLAASPGIRSALARRKGGGSAPRE